MHQQQIGMPLTLFYSYAHEDEALRGELEKHLSLLHQQGFVASWHDRLIRPGLDWAQEIDTYLNTAKIILLLVSPDFMASQYCYGVEMKRALECYTAEEAHVIPIILRPVDWETAPFGMLQALPTDGKAVTEWDNQDAAFRNIVQGLRQTIEATAKQAKELRGEILRTSTPSPSEVPPEQPPVPSFPPRRTMLRIVRTVVVGGLVALLMQSSLEFPSSSDQTPQFTPKPTTFHPPNPPSKIYTYREHTDVVEAVAWSPDGTRIASASWDKTVQVWDATNGGRISIYKGHTDQVYAVAWSPDSRHVASGAWDRTVQIWDATNGNFLINYQKHQNRVYAVAWSPDGTYIASGGLEETTGPVVHVWNAKTGKLLKICQGHTERIRHIAWSPDSRSIASCSEDATVRVWNAVDATTIYTYSGHRDRVISVAWSPTGKRIVSSSRDTTVHIWNAFDGRDALIYHGHSQEVETVAWRSGKNMEPCIASGAEDNTAQVWRVADGTGLQTLHASKEVESVTWSPDGTHLAFGSADYTVQVFLIP